MFKQKHILRDDYSGSDSMRPGSVEEPEKTALSDKERIQELEATVKHMNAQLEYHEKKFKLYDELIEKLSKR